MLKCYMIILLQSNVSTKAYRHHSDHSGQNPDYGIITDLLWQEPLVTE